MLNYITNSLILNHPCLIINPTCYFIVLLDFLLIINFRTFALILISKIDFNSLSVGELCATLWYSLGVRILLSAPTFILRTSPHDFWGFLNVLQTFGLQDIIFSLILSHGSKASQIEGV